MYCGACRYDIARGRARALPLSPPFALSRTLALSLPRSLTLSAHSSAAAAAEVAAEGAVLALETIALHSAGHGTPALSTAAPFEPKMRTSSKRGHEAARRCRTSAAHVTLRSSRNVRRRPDVVEYACDIVKDVRGSESNCEQDSR